MLTILHITFHNRICSMSSLGNAVEIWVDVSYTFPVYIKERKYHFWSSDILCVKMSLLSAIASY